MNIIIMISPIPYCHRHNWYIQTWIQRWARIDVMAWKRFITLTSQWARWRLKSQASRLFTQPFILVQITGNIVAPGHWHLCGEFTGDRWIPRTNGQQRGKCFHLMTSSFSASLSLYEEYLPFPGGFPKHSDCHTTVAVLSMYLFCPVCTCSLQFKQSCSDT